MEKAMFILDKPETCEDCPCFKQELSCAGAGLCYCGIDDHVVGYGKPVDCPLKSLTEHIKELKKYGNL